MLKTSDTIPSFELKDDKGINHKIEDYAGKKILLYFYPKDDTPGCTTEACNFRDSIEEFEKLGVVVFGISKDNIKSHKKFKEKYNLNFPLLFDKDGKVSESFGVLQDKSMFEKHYKGIVRTTFLIDEEGKVKKVWEKVNPLTHTKEVLDYLNINN